MDLDAIKKQAELIGSLRTQLKDMEVQIATVAGNYGQSTSARVTVNGVTFDVLRMNAAWMPEVIKGYEVIQREAVRLLTLRRTRLLSQIEGAEWKLHQLSKPGQ